MKYISEGFWGGVKFGIVFVSFLVIIDVMVVIFAIAQIASGVDTPHIGFWDAQIRFITKIID